MIHVFADPAQDWGQAQRLGMCASPATTHNNKQKCKQKQNNNKQNKHTNKNKNNENVNITKNPLQYRRCEELYNLFAYKVYI